MLQNNAMIQPLPNIFHVLSTVTKNKLYKKCINHTTMVQKNVSICPASPTFNPFPWYDNICELQLNFSHKPRCIQETSLLLLIITASSAPLAQLHPPQHRFQANLVPPSCVRMPEMRRRSWQQNNLPPSGYAHNVSLNCPSGVSRRGPGRIFPGLVMEQVSVRY